MTPDEWADATCETCRFYTEGKYEGHRGRCLRFPPTWHVDYCIAPHVAANAKCGEWQAAEEAS